VPSNYIINYLKINVRVILNYDSRSGNGVQSVYVISFELWNS
jgi:hypothetical protein